MSMDLEGVQMGAELEALDESRGMGRRSFLMGALAVGAAASAPVNYAAAARKAALPLAKDGAFKLGIASGFPRPRGIMLWTQLDGIKRSSKLRLLVATDKNFGNVVEERLVTAREDRGFTARTMVNGLKPREEYFYRFVTDESKSEVGRFRTAPPLDSKEKIRIAFYSCQNYEAGFFNAQRAISKEKDIDLVICLGDYMYEYSDNEGVRLDRTGRNKDGDVQFLDEYRQKYALYKRDKDLQAMHAAHPFISVWDDHEVEDNHADGKPSSAQEDPNKTNLKDYPRRVTYEQRRQNGYRAFFNYMPRGRFKGDRDRIYEDYRLGKLVDLMLTDERQYRDQQPCNDVQLAACPEQDDPRTMLGEKQRNWLLRSLKGSPATWKVWGTQLMVMATRLSPGVAAQVDAWDGYGHERRTILDYVVDNNINNIVAITGDIHTFFAGTAYTHGDRDAPGSRAAFPEFVGGSATSAGLPESTGLPADALAFLATVNPHIDFYDFATKGYGVVTAKKNELICELKGVDHTTKGAGASRVLARYRVTPGNRIPQKIA
jgi:alkaline phosphatase D